MLYLDLAPFKRENVILVLLVATNFLAKFGPLRQCSVLSKHIPQNRYAFAAVTIRRKCNCIFLGRMPRNDSMEN